MKYGLQLYSVRDITKDDFEGALKQVAEMGYDMVEPAGFFGHPADEVAAMLRHYGLTCCSTHTGVDEVFGNCDATIAYHKAIGCENIIIPGAKFSTAEEVAQLVKNINLYQPKIEAAGLQLHYHNHSREFMPNRDGQIVEDVLAEQTNILFQLDTFWVYNAGLRAVDVMEKFRGRMKLIHLKDGIAQDFSNPESRAQGKSVGEGDAPVEEVRAKAIDMGLKIVVESEGLSPTGPEEVKRCIDFLRALDAKDGK